MRHPLRRIESHARHTQRTKREVGRFPSPRADHSLEAGISPVNLAVSRYAYQLEPYRPFLDRGRLHLTSLEALHANFEAEIARILALIGLPPAPGQAQARHSNRANEKGQPTWLSNRLRHGRALSFLSSEQRAVIARRFERRLELPGRFRLTREEMTRLCNVYNAEMDRLSREFEFPAAGGLAALRR